MNPAFSIARLPRIEFGPGCREKLPNLAQSFGRRFLLVTGRSSFPDSPFWKEFRTAMKNAGFSWEHLVVSGEPSPQLVDDAVQKFCSAELQFVIGIGGGSVLDAGKAVAGLLGIGDSVMEYLEGVGKGKQYQGPAVPYIAVPTTAGTGSEATKNAVLSVQNKHGFKKSFRDDQLVPQYAIVDPDLFASCPADLIAANGMDAFTQLLESFVSLRANPLTDALAISGLQAVRDGLLGWYEGSAGAETGRINMAYAALLSGVTLAQTGLGSVHGLASPLGAFFPIPHGVVCGTLMAEAAQFNIEAMYTREPENKALEKYAQAATMLTQQNYGTPRVACAALIKLLRDWTLQLALPQLREYGITEGDFTDIITNCRSGSMLTNPIVLADHELESLLRSRL